MQLLWIRYVKKDSSQSYILLLYLGTHNGKIYGLDTKFVPDTHKKDIVVQIANLSLGDRVSWLKKHLPEVMCAYRSLDEKRAFIEKSYNIDDSKMR